MRIMVAALALILTLALLPSSVIPATGDVYLQRPAKKVGPDRINTTTRNKPSFPVAPKDWADSSGVSPDKKNSRRIIPC